MAREVKISGRTVYLTDRDEWEETPTEPAPRAGPYALGFEVSGFVEHERYEPVVVAQVLVPAQYLGGGGYLLCAQWFERMADGPGGSFGG